MRYDKPTEPFYRTSAWRRVRQLALQRDMGMCADCLQRVRDGAMKKPNRATMVHHVIPYKERPDLALDLGNLVSLCDSCHELRHRRNASQEQKTPEGIRVIKL